MKKLYLISLVLILTSTSIAQNFTRHTISATYDEPWRIIPADLDGDQDNDLVVLTTSSTDDHIFCLENVDGSFDITNKVTIQAVYDPNAQGLAVGDLDGDGDLDVAATNDSIDISWWANDGNPFDGTGFTRQSSITHTHQRIEMLEIVDIDATNNNDLLVPYFERGYDVAYWENDGSASPSFTERVINDTTYRMEFLTYALSGDFDNDGDLDVVACAISDSTIQWFENDGAVPWTAHLITDAFQDIRTLRVYDIDRDGMIDVIGGSNDYNNQGGPKQDTNDSLIIYYNQSNGTSWSKQKIAELGDITYISARDLDGDGDIDLLASSGVINYDGAGNINKLVRYENDGTNNFTAYEIATSYHGARSLITADIDGDGDPDLVSVGYDPDNDDDGGIDWWENDAEDKKTVASGDSAFFWNNKVKIIFNTSSGGLDTTTVFYDSEDVPNTSSLGSGVKEVYSEGFYTITTEKSTYDATLKFAYSGVTQWATVSDERDLIICFWNGSNWVKAGTSQTLDTQNDTITVAGISSFGKFVLAVANAVNGNVKVFLEGPYQADGDTMATALLNDGVIPLSHPFSGSPWNYTGDESVSSIPADVVDWVLVGLRTGTDAATQVARRAGFIKKDGTIVDLDGSSQLHFSGVDVGSYYVVIYHRNHLAVMSANAVSLSDGTSTLYDFTSGSSQFYNDGGTEIETGVFGMYSGDANSDGQVLNDDKNDYWKTQVGEAGYKSSDFNLDGQVLNDDKNDVWKNNVGNGTQVPE